MTQPGYEEIEQTRARLQREVERVLDEKYRWNIHVRSYNYDRWKRDFDAAINRRREWNERYPKPAVPDSAQPVPATAPVRDFPPATFVTRTLKT